MTGILTGWQRKGGDIGRMWNKHAAGMAFGVVFGVWVVFIVMYHELTGTAADVVALYTDIVPGLSPAPEGIIFGFLGAFIEGYVLGWILAWVYNRVAEK